MEDEEDDDDDEDDEEEEEEDEGDDEDEHTLTFDHQMDDSEAGVDSGTTAVVALLRKRSLFVANAGDSRCVLCRSGKALDLSVDHKPEDEPERNRIMKAGGVVTQVIFTLIGVIHFILAVFYNCFQLLIFHHTENVLFDYSVQKKSGRSANSS